MNRQMEQTPSRPHDFLHFWNARWNRAAVSGGIEMKKVEMRNPAAEYYELYCTAADGTLLKARYICPVIGDTLPTVLMFHDYGREIRGWHHMTRFAALGFAVLALENRVFRFDVTSRWETGPEGMLVTELFTDALTLAQVARHLPRTDLSRLMTWGEGFGGGLAVAAAAMAGCKKCAALNPIPADFRTAWKESSGEGLYGGIRTYFRERDPVHEQEDALFCVLDYVDCLNFAPMLQGSLLLGTGALDPLAPPDTQKALFDQAVCDKQRIVYPKYGHERINFYENEQLKFMLRL